MAVNKCVKVLLFIFNFLFWVCGCIILGISIYLKVSKDANKITSENLPGIDLMIAIGAIIMVLGFLGCCGAIRENRCMLLLFFIFLLIIFVLLVAAGITGAVSKNTLKDWVSKNLEQLTPLANQPQEVQDDLKKLQKELKCCGLVNGLSDWNGVTPDTCRCNSTATNANECKNNLYTQPCTDKIIQVLENNMVIVLGVAFAIAGVLIFGMVFSMMLYCQIGRKDAASTA